MNTKNTDVNIQRFFENYVKFKEGTITNQSDETFAINFPNDDSPKEYTYQPALSREKKIPLIAPGSPAFRQILKDCLENGVLCQILLNPRESYESLIKNHFKDSPFSCNNCDKVTMGEDLIRICKKTQPCYHQINNAKITSINIIKKESVKYFLFYFSATFQNKLRPKNEEIITILLDEAGNTVKIEDFNENKILANKEIKIQDFKSKLKVEVFDSQKKVADERLDVILKEKAVLFDLTVSREKKAKLRNFEKRLRIERREQIISRKHDFDPLKWQINYEALLKREEESFITNIAVEFLNLLIINTSKVKFQVNLENHSAINSSFILGLENIWAVPCPVCKKDFFEGYATQDSLYVCERCIKQSIDTKKMYSKKATLRLDETLNEFIEQNSGFICSVCGKKHSRLLEFKCNHDNSSVCIHHYGLCDICGKTFSRLNLTYTDEFRRQLCPKHTAKKMQ